MRIPALLLLAVVAGCQRRTPTTPTDAASDALSTWVRAQLDLRTWRSCARAGGGGDLEQAVAVFPIAEDGAVGTVSLEPVALVRDPAMICLQMELADPPDRVPHQGPARELRLPVGGLHEIPVAPEG